MSPDEDAISRELTPFDEPARFGVRITCTMKDGSKQVYERATPKVNSWVGKLPDPLLTEVDGVRSERPLAELQVQFVSIDTPGEFISVVEARLPGNDVPVHRGVEVKMKDGKLLEMQQGSF